MAKHLTEADRDFRAVVEAFDGHQPSIAQALATSQQNVSARLRAEKHATWWRALKKKRSKRRRAERQRAYRQRAAQRVAESWYGVGVIAPTDPGFDPGSVR
jgi:ParB-like chromosome segregation protein Spo0J